MWIDWGLVKSFWAWGCWKSMIQALELWEGLNGHDGDDAHG
jgi:hypothetical protein